MTMNSKAKSTNYPLNIKHK